ncbi:MAG TPA: ABC transporter permease [Chloroflexota bacterium]|nr:ABC transporter permease [Chloroflexota bacterium]
MNWLTDSGVWTTFLNTNLWSTTLIEATPLTLAAIGGVISERSGVVNIGMEGMMLTGAFFAVVVSILSNNAGLGVLAGVLTGGVMALVHAFASIRLKADQIISGMAINLLALGLTSYLYFSVYGSAGTTPCSSTCAPGDVRGVLNWPIPVLDRSPALGQILFQQNPIVYAMLLLVLLTHFFLFRTTLGLRIRAVGEHPRAVDTAGINVQHLRYLAVTLSGLLSGLGGAFLSLGWAGNFSENMTSGRGFIALAAMIFGKWTPFGAFGACLLFGFGSALYDTLQNNTGPVQDYSTLIATLPYVLTIVALAGFIGRSTPPASDGIPYDPAAG